MIFLKKQTKYLLLIFCSTFLQGSSFVSTKIVLTEVSPLWLASLRFFIAALTILPWLWFMKSKATTQDIRITIKTMPWLMIMIIGLLQTTGVMAFLNIGLEHTTTSRAAILMASNPLIVGSLSSIFLKIRVNTLSWLGLTISFFGVTVCIGLHSVIAGKISHGDILVIMGSSCWALSTLISKRKKINVDVWTISFWQMMIGSVVLAGLSFYFNEPVSFPDKTIFAFLWLAIPASTVAMCLWFTALNMGDAVRTSGYLFLCPFFAAVISFIVRGELISGNELFGGALIFIGILLMSHSSEKEKIAN